MCTKCCGMISEENSFSEESGRPVAMQPVSGRNRGLQSHATGIRTHPASAVPSNLYPDAPGARGVPGGFSTSGRTAASPNGHFFLADADWNTGRQPAAVRQPLCNSHFLFSSSQADFGHPAIPPEDQMIEFKEGEVWV